MLSLPKTPSPGHRYVYVYGNSSQDIEVAVNIESSFTVEIFKHQIIQDPYFPELGSALFAICLPHYFNGAIPVSITVHQGTIQVTRARAYYPCVVYDSNHQESWHWYSLFQPIPDPKWFVKINGELQTRFHLPKTQQGECHYHLGAGDVMSYWHASYAGPRYWYIEYSNDQCPTVVDQQDKNISLTHWDNYHDLKSIKQRLRDGL